MSDDYLRIQFSIPVNGIISSLVRNKMPREKRRQRIGQSVDESIVARVVKALVIPCIGDARTMHMLRQVCRSWKEQCDDASIRWIHRTCAPLPPLVSVADFWSWGRENWHVSP